MGDFHFLFWNKSENWSPLLKISLQQYIYSHCTGHRNSIPNTRGGEPDRAPFRWTRYASSFFSDSSFVFFFYFSLLVCKVLIMGDPEMGKDDENGGKGRRWETGQWLRTRGREREREWQWRTQQLSLSLLLLIFLSHYPSLSVCCVWMGFWSVWVLFGRCGMGDEKLDVGVVRGFGDVDDSFMFASLLLPSIWARAEQIVVLCRGGISFQLNWKWVALFSLWAVFVTAALTWNGKREKHLLLPLGQHCLWPFWGTWTTTQVPTVCYSHGWPVENHNL